MGLQKPYERLCDRCGHGVTDRDEFCEQCGTLVDGTFSCQTHPDRLASGACVICGAAYCGGCGKWLHGVFLCREHQQYEVRKHNVRLLGSERPGPVVEAVAALAGAQVHVEIWTVSGQKLPPESVHAGVPGGEEMQVMVPVREALAGLEVLREHGLLDADSQGERP